MSADLSPSPAQAVTLLREDVERLENASYALWRASENEHAISLEALALRIRVEAGWTAETSNVTPIR